MRLLTLFPVLFALGAVADLLYVDFPHLLIPINKTSPNTVYGTVKTGEVSNNVWTEVSFDVRNDIPGVKICRINFHINTNPSKNAPRSLSGVAPYEFVIYRTTSNMDQTKDSWNHSPMITNYLAAVKLTQDGAVELTDGWFQCPLGDVAQFVLTPVTDTRAFKYTWFELDYPEEQGGPHGITLEMHS
ncbi:hypothetical protein ACEQ8H_007017 [Pleosporales sp. CAS-2024a]